MAKTVETSAVSYCPASEAVKRLDWRPFADLCSDNNGRITDSSTLQGNANFLALLLDASGEIESAVLRGGRYHPTDLAALTGAGQAKLYRLVCRLTLVLAYERRADIEMKQPWIVEKVERDLEALATGQNIFSFLETEEAGVMADEIETATDVRARQGLSYQMRRYFGRRSNRNDPTRQ